jgi:hypothetical protein
LQRLAKTPVQGFLRRIETRFAFEQ